MTHRPSSDHRHAASRQAEYERQPRRSAKGAGAGTPRFLQRRALEIDAPTSPLERQADVVAEQVMRMPDGAARHSTGAASSGEEPSLRRTAAPGAATSLSPSAAPAVEAALGTGGVPLPAPQRAFFEPRLGSDLSSVRIHTDATAGAAARAIGAKAFTQGSDIYFGAGRFVPHSGDGRRLLAHELAHTLQSSDAGLLQADFESDFAGRSQVRVVETPVRPQGTIRVIDAAGEAVYAPYGIYRPQDVPAQYRDRIMDSTQAVTIRHPGAHPADLSRLMLTEGLNQEITVEHMRRFAESLASGVQIRVIMARVDNDMRFVGWDQISASSSGMYTGFVESQVGTGGVGRALFADRVVRALQSGVPEMHLEVYSSERRPTETFHAEIYRVAGLSGQPQPEEHYRLNTRQMARVALAWSDGLSESQRFALVPVAAGQREPTPAEAQRILGGASGPGSGGTGLVTGGFAPATRTEMQAFAEQVNRNVRRPAQLERLEDLHRRDVQERLVRDHAGFASIGQRLYRVQAEGDALRTREVMSELIWRPAPSPPRPESRLFEPLLPFPMGPLPVALDPARRVRIGSMLLEPPTETSLVAGDIVIVHSGLTFSARDARSGRPLVGIYEGGEWYRVLGPNGRHLEVEAVTGEAVRQIEIGGRRMLVEPFGPQPVASPRGVGARAVAGGVGLIMIANEILGPAGAALRNQRAAIAEGEAELKLWTELGADPLPGMWDVWGKGPVSRQKPDTALFGTWYYPYVVDIDGEKLRAELPRRVRSYYELQILLDSAQPLGAIQKRDERWYAVVNRPARGAWKIYDITEAIRTVESLTIGAAEAGLRERLAATPESGRKGRIFRIKPGATLYRSRGGLFNQQPLHGAGDRLGPYALVREIRRTDFLVSTDRMFVEPVNADAYRAVALAAYRINESIEDVWEEVKDSGREVTPAKLPRFGDGPLNRFTAGPETEGEQRFGYTTYIRDPGKPGAGTAALGEIRKFWVSVDDVTRVTEEEVAAYLR